MIATVERLSPSKVKVHYEVDANAFEEALNKVYMRDRARAKIPGFRPGKAPRPIVERFFGFDYMAYQAMRMLFPDMYKKTLEEHGLQPVDEPSLNMETAVKGQPLLFTAEVTVYPQVLLGDYKSIDVEKSDDFFDEDDVEEEIERIRARNARIIDIEDRPAQEDDDVVVDFVGYVDGKTFEGGSGTNERVRLGSGEWIPGFEDQIIGMNVGEERDISTTFPDAYGNEELRAKDVVYHVKLKSLSFSELPDLDDEFAKDVSEFDTLEEYRESVRKEKQIEAEKAADSEWDEALLYELVQISTTEVPEIMVEREVETDVYDYALRTFKSDRAKADEFYERIRGMNEIRDMYRTHAAKRLKTILCVDELAKAEKLEYDEERDRDMLVEVLEEAGYTRNMTLDEALKRVEDDPRLKQNLAEIVGRRKVQAFLRDVARSNTQRDVEPVAYEVGEPGEAPDVGDVAELSAQLSEVLDADDVAELSAQPGETPDAGGVADACDL